MLKIADCAHQNQVSFWEVIGAPEHMLLAGIIAVGISIAIIACLLEYGISDIEIGRASCRERV